MEMGEGKQGKEETIKNNREKRERSKKHRKKIRGKEKVHCKGNVQNEKIVSMRTRCDERRSAEGKTRWK